VLKDPAAAELVQAALKARPEDRRGPFSPAVVMLQFNDLPQELHR